MSNSNLKEILIKAPEGMMIDMDVFNKTQQVVFIKEKANKVEYPKEWDISHLNKGWFINRTSDINITTGNIDTVGIPTKDCNFNILPTKELAEQMIVLTKLITMRERYREIELKNNPELEPIDWNDKTQVKYVIKYCGDKFAFDTYYTALYTFSFLTEETRNLFYCNFKADLEIIKDIIG